MDQDVTAIISRLETRTRQLMLQYDKMKQQLEDMENKLSEQSRHCTKLEAENQALEEKYTRLKMARLIDMADDDELKTTRKRINKMIASVDKCLATLKVQ
jgi:prefoldin subunit 5